MVIIGNEQIVYIWLPRTWSPERFANNGWQRGQENMWPSFAINQSEPKGWSLQFLKRGWEQRDFFFSLYSSSIGLCSSYVLWFGLGYASYPLVLRKYDYALTHW